MIVRKFNSTGIERFREWLSLSRAGVDAPPPLELLTDAAASEPLPHHLELDVSRSFPTRLEFGEYLLEILKPLDASMPELDSDVAFWSWLSLGLVEQVCPILKGQRKVGADDRYILTGDYNRRYRHLVRTAWLLVKLHGKHARVVLSGEVHQHGEAAEQFLSRQQLFTNHSFFAALDQLYVVDKKNGWRIKSGARAKTGGSMRRLGKVMRQYDLTWDLNGMRPEELYQLLPPEFEAFKRLG